MPYTIVIDAGHGGSDPGAVYEGRREKDDNLSLAIAVGELLSRQGVSVIYTRTTDVYQTPFEKAQMANQADADFFISFHRNSSEDPNQYTGVETLVYDNSGIKQTMAENINGALSGLGFRNLGVKARPGLVVLRRTKMPALLIETGFLNNEQDNTLYDEKQEEIARAIADAVLGTLDLETVTEADRRAAETEAARPSVSTADTVTASASPRPTPPEQEILPTHRKPSTVSRPAFSASARMPTVCFTTFSTRAIPLFFSPRTAFSRSRSALTASSEMPF